MSEQDTQPQPDTRSFEERVFARFDAIDGRLATLEKKADASSYETKPIWERALTEIAETRREMNQYFKDFDVRLDRVESVVNATRGEMLTLRADFKEYRAHEEVKS